MKRLLKVFAITLIVIAALAIAALLILPVFVKKKLVGYVEQHTDYTLKIDAIDLGWNEVVIHGIEFKPKRNKEAFFKQKGFETDWVRGKLQIIKIKGINWKNVIQGRHYKINYIDIDQADIYVYRDKRMPDVFKYKPLLSSLLREAKVRFTVPEIKLTRSNVVYEEVQKKTGEPVKISFNQLNAVISHVSSDNIYLDKNPVMTIAADAMILDSIKTHVDYSANTRNKTDEFMVKGRVHSFSATQLNRCIEPAAKARIVSGYINQIDFSFTGNNNSSKGVLNMDYHDLKLKVDEEVKQNKVKTLLANFFVKNDDHKKRGETNTGEIDFTRRKDRFIFNYWWNSFKSGIVSSVLKKPAQK
ncbi:MAG: hypothetical protein V4658_11560, partial [Bacteroidota bacterium]